MRVRQGAQLVPIVLRRLVVTGLADFDREQVRRYFALMHDNVGVNRLSQMIVCRDDGAVGQPQRPLAKPVVVAIDLPPRKLVFQMHSQPVRQRALAQIMVEQEALAAIKLGERRHDFVQFRLHRLPDTGNACAERRCNPQPRFVLQLVGELVIAGALAVHGALTAIDCAFSRESARCGVYIRTSISRGPRSGIASASAATSSSAVVTARPGTPIPLASATKSSVGRSSFSMSCAR